MVRALIELSKEPTAQRIARQMVGRGIEEIGKVIEQYGLRMQNQ